MNDPNMKFKLTVLKTATFENKFWRKFPIIRGRLPMWKILCIATKSE